MLEILTPLSKLHRISRIIDPSNFVAVPGIWGDLQADGTLDNITVDTPSINCELVISSASANVYESHDIEVGRISVISEPGVRCKVDEEGYYDTANIAIGVDLVVKTETGYEGKLAAAVVADAPAGTYAIVARVIEFDATANILTYITVSPRSITTV